MIYYNFWMLIYIMVNGNMEEPNIPHRCALFSLKVGKHIYQNLNIFLGHLSIVVHYLFHPLVLILSSKLEQSPTIYQHCSFLHLFPLLSFSSTYNSHSILTSTSSKQRITKCPLILNLNLMELKIVKSLYFKCSNNCSAVKITRFDYVCWTEKMFLWKHGLCFFSATRQL